MEGPSGFGGRMPRGEGLAKKKKRVAGPGLTQGTLSDSVVARVRPQCDFANHGINMQTAYRRSEKQIHRKNSEAILVM